MVAPETSLQAKFDLFVGEPNESGCWIWLGRIDKYGYGRLSHKSQFWLAHRASFVLSIGEIPEAMFVLHRCDVRHCVNPDHLFLGTNADNMADKTAKGRQVIGSQSCWAKLNEQKVGEIRKHLGTFENQADAAMAYDEAAKKIFGEFASVNFA